MSDVFILITCTTIRNVHTHINRSTFITIYHNLHCSCVAEVCITKISAVSTPRVQVTVLGKWRKVHPLKVWHFFLCFPCFLLPLDRRWVIQSIPLYRGWCFFLCNNSDRELCSAALELLLVVISYVFNWSTVTD